MERKLAELIEKEAIREQIYNYCRALDRIDNELGYTIFAEDAKVDYGPTYKGTGRGFTFSDINAGDMLWVIREAVDLYHNNKEAWRGLQKEGMTADFSWDHSAQEYIDIYQRISG